MTSIDYVSPQRLLRAVDIQLQEFVTVTYGSAQVPPAFAAAREHANGPGGVLDLFIDRYDTLVARGVFADDIVLRYALVVQSLSKLSRTARCTGAQSRAAIALLNATCAPGCEESIDVVGCRAEIEAELSALPRASAHDKGKQR
ncbi:MAG: hypothetical protein WD492_05915 [Alkalispirochaeta sp.]